MKYKGNGRGAATNEAQQEVKRPRQSSHESAETEFWLTDEYEERFKKELVEHHDRCLAHRATQEAMKNGWR